MHTESKQKWNTPTRMYKTNQHHSNQLKEKPPRYMDKSQQEKQWGEIHHWLRNNQ